ncbi:MAG: hypothetical protein KGL69_00350, partial [Alphaproteobacteria bacterium]|nr:hypothetical protein [Alphaproteobacteria bacterium]
MTTIAIDGFNISLPQGSGIATYARNLNQAVRGLGHQTDLIFGPPRLRKDPILAELDLFDAPTISPTGWPRPGAMLGYLTSPFGRTLRRVAAADAVITRQIAPRAPDHDAIWACADLFHTANRGFAARRRFTPVTFDRAAGPPP